MNSKLIINLCTAVEVGCMLALAGIGLKRNSDCYKAEVKLVNTQMDLIKERMYNELKDVEIRKLKEELAGLKAKEEVEES